MLQELREGFDIKKIKFKDPILNRNNPDGVNKNIYYRSPDRTICVKNMITLINCLFDSCNMNKYYYNYYKTILNNINNIEDIIYNNFDRKVNMHLVNLKRFITHNYREITVGRMNEISSDSIREYLVS